ncbi:MAG: hypothetical protein JRJ69_16790, partial [Deltaproteobacteria bacterium]|nr:hypothetical protein [Deltaproteobacteria bacterium]
LIQRARGTGGDSYPKDKGSKASAGTYRTHQLSVGVGQAKKNPRLINMNSWLKPREKRAAKRELNVGNLDYAARPKKAMASGVYGGISYAKLGRMVPGVKREPKGSVKCSFYRTSETLLPVSDERRGEIGIKRMFLVMQEIDLMVNPKGCPLPVTSQLEGTQVIYP